MRSDFIKTVSETDFEYEVIAYSRQAPVIVDFWAEWCRPCKSLTPILEAIAQDGAGAFRLAEVNVDDNPNLALRFSVRSLPNVKAFRDGQIVSEFLGLQPEPRVREFIRNIAPSQSDLLLEKGNSFLYSLKWEQAADSFKQFLEKAPGYPAALLGLLRAYLVLGKYSEARKILGDFPASPEYTRVQLIRPLYDVLVEPENRLETSDNPLETTFRGAIRLIQRGNLPAALDGLMDILRQDKHFRNDLARKVILGLFEILGDDHPYTQQYRRELATVIF